MSFFVILTLMLMHHLPVFGRLFTTNELWFLTGFGVFITIVAPLLNYTIRKLE